MRNLGLDLLRIVSVLLVIGRHLRIPKTAHFGFHAWQRGGWVGVDLFFVLSGFLIASLLFKEYLRFGSINVKRFLIRRGFKIYPAFWLFIAVSLVILEVFFARSPTPKQLFAELFFFQNYLGGMWNHTWSLAVEEHFYFGIAALFTGLMALRPQEPFKRIPTIFVCVAIACFSFRLLNLFFFPQFSPKAYLFGTHLRVDSLLFGVLIAYLVNFRGLESRIAWIPSSILFLAGCLLLSPAFFFQVETNKWISILGVVLFYCGGGLCLLAALRLETSDSRLLNLLGGLGAASYSIYLWHMPVVLWGYPLLSKVSGMRNFSFQLVTSVVGACAVGWLLNRLIERPVLMVRDRIFPSLSGNENPIKQSERHRASSRALAEGESSAAAG